jgi:integrase
VLALPNERTMARTLRRWLRHAGVTRDELHEASPTRKEAHPWRDARATGITWLAVAGLDASKIQRRAGHTTIETTMV